MKEGFKREVITTTDGSVSIFVPDLNVSYHSKYGAIQESMHVFIEAGFRDWLDMNHGAMSRNQQVKIFEMGFGTGLNVFLTAIEAREKGINIYYEAIEQFPLTEEEISLLNYTSVLNNEDLFRKIHGCKWNEEIALNEFFMLKKISGDLITYSTAAMSKGEGFNIIYYDAFAPLAQPELWTAEIFKKLYSMLAPGGILVTYCSKGIVRRTMQAAGFAVEKIPGPPGKREMIRAKKVYGL